MCLILVKQLVRSRSVWWEGKKGLRGNTKTKKEGRLVRDLVSGSYWRSTWQVGEKGTSDRSLRWEDTTNVSFVKANDPCIISFISDIVIRCKKVFVVSNQNTKTMLTVCYLTCVNLTCKTFKILFMYGHFGGVNFITYVSNDVLQKSNSRTERGMGQGLDLWWLEERLWYLIKRKRYQNLFTLVRYSWENQT